MPREDLRVSAADGTSLRVGVWRPDGAPRFAVVVSHGQSEHVVRHAWLAEALVAEGGLVFGPDHRGEGRSGGRRGHVERYEIFAGDLALVTEKVLADVPADVPRLLFGQSMGALIGLILLLDHGARLGIGGAVLSAPFIELAMEIGVAKRALARVANFVAPTLAIPGGIPVEDVLACPELRQAYDSDPDRTRTVTPRWVAATEAAQARVLAEISRVEIPMLWYAGTADRITKPETTRRLFSGLRRPGEHDQVLEMLEGVLHEPHNEPKGQREPIRQRAVDWLLAHAVKA